MWALFQATESGLYLSELVVTTNLYYFYTEFMNKLLSWIFSRAKLHLHLVATNCDYIYVLKGLFFFLPLIILSLYMLKSVNLYFWQDGNSNIATTAWGKTKLIIYSKQPKNWFSSAWLKPIDIYKREYLGYFLLVCFSDNVTFMDIVKEMTDLRSIIKLSKYYSRIIYSTSYQLRMYFIQAWRWPATYIYGSLKA